MRCDVVVVGAGVAGSAVAIQLARAGLDVVIIEKQRFPRRKVCGECVSANCLHLLDELGVAVPSGAPLETLVLACQDTSITAPMPAALHGAHRWSRAIAREALDPALLALARASGVRVLQPARVTAVPGGFGQTLCTVDLLDDSQREQVQIATRAVVAANGSWETPLLPRPPRHGGLLAFKATFAGARLRPGSLPVMALPGGYGGMVVGADGLLTIACCLRADVFQRLRGSLGVPAGLAVERFLIDQCAAVADALDGTQRIGGWIGSGPLAPGVHVAPGQPMFLVGNAAGEAHPILGEGISMALHGARLLAEHLAGRGVLAADTLVQAQARYARAWRSRLAGRVHLSRLVVALAMRPSLAPALLPPLQRWPGLLTLLARAGGKTQFSVAAPAG